MKISVNLIEKDYKAFRRFVMFHIQQIHWFYAVLFVILEINLWSGHRPDTGLWFKVFAAVVVVPLVLVFVTAFFTGLTLLFRKLRGVTFQSQCGPHEYEINADVLIEMNAAGRTETRLDQIRKVYDTPKYLFIVMKNGMAHIIPKRDLQDEGVIEEVRAKLGVSVKTARDVCLPGETPVKKFKKTRTAVKWFFIVWGGVSFSFTMLSVGLFAYYSAIGNKESNSSVRTEEVQFVLSRCSLGDDRVEEILHSYKSPCSFTGDYSRAYAVKISDIHIEELRGGDWQRADEVTGVYKDAVDFMSGWLGQEIPWFPAIDEIRSDKYYVYLLGFSFYGSKPDSASVVLVRPHDNMAFYFNASRKGVDGCAF